jgi:hypothetical protein
MRRVARHLFAPCSAGSLLVCAALRVLWARSQGSAVDAYYWPRAAAVSWDGAVHVERSSGPPAGAPLALRGYARRPGLQAVFDMRGPFVDSERG